MANEENGLDELIRLSQQFTRQQKEHEEKEKQRQEQGRKVQGVLRGLRELKVSMAIEQLNAIATPEIIDKVNTLRNKEGTEDLRKMLSSLADDLENRLDAIAASNRDAASLMNSMRTLNILMDLYFSL